MAHSPDMSITRGDLTAERDRFRQELTLIAAYAGRKIIEIDNGEEDDPQRGYELIVDRIERVLRFVVPPEVV